MRWMMRAMVAGMAIGAVSCASVYAQSGTGCVARWTPEIGVMGVNGTVSAILVHSSGDVFVGGSFDAAGGVAASGVARYRRATNTWAALGSGVRVGSTGAGTVNAIVELPGGDVVVGGNFFYAGSVEAGPVARYRIASADWAKLGSSSVPSISGSNPEVKSLARMPNGDVVAGGTFAYVVNGSSSGFANNLARYHVATDTWTATVPGPDNEVQTMAVAPSGELLVGGAFRHVGGLTIRAFAQYTPATESWSAMGLVSQSSYVRSIVPLPNGDIVMSLEGPWQRYSAATGTWGAMGAGSSHTGWLASLPNGRVLCFEGFQVGGQNGNYATFEPSTGQWALVPAWRTATGGVLAIDIDGTVLSGASQPLALGRAQGIARGDLTTGTWAALGKGTDGAVRSLARLDSGEVVGGGAFTVMDGAAANRVAVRDPATGAWSGLGSGTNGTVSAVAGGPGRRAYVGGAFSMAGGVGASNVAIVDLATGVYSPMGAGTDGAVSAVARLSGGDVFVGGTFANAGGSAAANVARYRPETGAWGALGSGVSGSAAKVSLIVELGGGDALVGGQFDTAGGVVSPSLARYRPSTGVWLSAGSGISDVGASVQCAAKLPNGDVAVVWTYPTSGSNAGWKMGRYSPQLDAWIGTPVAVGAGTAAVVAAGNEEVVAGGSFVFDRTVLGQGIVTYTRLARYTLSTGAVVALPAPPGAVLAMTPLGRGDVLVSGSITSSTPAGFAGTLSLGAVCAGDFDCSGALSVQDIFEFINAWYGGSLRADFDGVNGLDVMDIFGFLEAWLVGC